MGHEMSLFPKVLYWIDCRWTVLFKTSFQLKVEIHHLKRVRKEYSQDGGRGHAGITNHIILYCSAESSSVFTFDLHQHEVLVGHGTVVGHLLRDVDAAQTHAAEVLFTGQTCQSSVGVLRGFIYWKEKEYIFL